MPFHAQHVRAALVQLKKNDPVMRQLIRDVGPFRMRADRDHFGMLVRSIVSQQISTAAAKTILGRLLDSLGGSFDPVRLSELSIEGLRQAGVSKQKAGYLLDLSEKVSSGQIDLRRLARDDDSCVIGQLTSVKGIGVWTAQMFLMFSLARMDVLPVGDLGIRTAVRNLWGLEELPGAREIEEIAQPWRPHATVASWYLWRSLEIRK